MGFALPNIKDSLVTTFPIESIDKNIIFFEAYDSMIVDSARILAHEMGHDFEFENALNAEYKLKAVAVNYVYMTASADNQFFSACFVAGIFYVGIIKLCRNSS